MEWTEEEWVCRGRVGARFQQERRQGDVAVLQGGGFRRADLISPNYIAQCMGGGVEGKGRAEPRVSLSLSLSHLSLSHLSLSRLSLSHVGARFQQERRQGDVAVLSFCRCQLPHKSVNLSFTITNIKNTLTDLCGN